MRTQAAAAFVPALLIAMGLTAQTNAPTHEAPAPVPPFTVASIKPSRTIGRPRSSMRTTGAQLIIRNQPLIMIVENAWNIPFDSVRLSGGPEWIRTERFDIDALPDDGALPRSLAPQARYDRMMLMLQRLLADRFHLVMRRETKEASVYAVVTAKGGVKLQKAKVTALGVDDCPDIPANAAFDCHYITGGPGGGIEADAASVSDLASFMERWTDRPVVDQSGVDGLYQIVTEGWAQMRQTPIQAPQSPKLSLFDVFAQMGLKLETKRLPVEAFVIDHIEKPSEN